MRGFYDKSGGEREKRTRRSSEEHGARYGGEHALYQETEVPQFERVG